MVAFGTLLSSFWILAANSWMQTPAGYEIIDGRFFPTDWFAVIFNPSFPYRLAHTVVGFYITTGCAVVAVSAYLLVRRKVGRRGADDACRSRSGCSACWCRCRSSSATSTG